MKDPSGQEHKGSRYITSFQLSDETWKPK